MNPSDIQRIEAEAEQAHATTAVVLLAQDIAEPEAHQVTLNTAIGGLDSLVTHFDGLVKHYSNLRDQTKDLRRKLERDFDNTKAVYWRLRDEKKRTSPQS